MKPQEERTRKRTANNKTTSSYRISDELWAVLEPVLPVHENRHRFGGGRPRKPDGICADGIFYVLRTGCQWKALDETDICPGSTAHDRFQEWVAAGVFLKLWQAGLEQFDELQGIDWEWLSLAQGAPRAMTKAPLGREKNRPGCPLGPHRPRQSRGETQPADRRSRRARWPGGGGGQSP